MRIVNFISGKDIGGPKQSFLLYSKILRSYNYDVISIIRKGAKLVKELEKENLAYKEIDYLRTTIPLFFSFSIKKIKKTLEPYNADIIIVHKQIDIELVRKAFPKSKIIGVIHGFNAKHIEGADALFAVSKKVKEFLLKNGYKKEVYIVPNMIENTTPVRFKNFSRPVQIGSMGVFRRKKGFHILIKALGILRAEGVIFKAKIAGRGLRRFVYYYLRFKYKLQKHLEILPWILSEKREEFFDSLDIYIMPSRTESFGMVVAEAMGRAKIVVSTKCGGPEEIIDNEVNGILVENQNPKALALAIKKVLERDDIITLQKNAYEKAIKEYSIKSVGVKIDNLLKKITDG